MSRCAGDGQPVCVVHADRRVPGLSVLATGGREGAQGHHVQRRLPVTLVVSTCATYAPTTVPHLMASLAAAGVSPDDVLVVCGQAPETEGAAEVSVRCPARVRRTPLSHAESVALCYVARHLDLLPTEWAFFMHDTMAALPNFVEKVLEIHRAVLSTTRADVVKLLDRFSMSVAFVRKEWIARHADRLWGMLRRLDTDDDVRRLKMVCEDAAFQGAHHVHLGTFDGDRRVVGTMRYAPDAAERLVEEYPFAGLIKYKSWYGQPVPTKTTAQGEVLCIPVGV